MVMFCTLKQRLMHLILAILSLGMVVAGSLLATPLNNVFDTQPIYTPFGHDAFFVEKEKGEIRFHISPFYQQTSTARDGDGKKVPGGDRLDKWNMFGVFFGSGGDPKGAAGLELNYPAALGPAKTAVAVATNQAIAAQNHYHANADLTLESNFKPDMYKFAFFSVPTNYEKIGLRSQLNIDFGFGLGVAVKGGVVDVKNKPRSFNLVDEQFARDVGLPVSTAGTNSSDEADGVIIYNALFEPTARDAVAKDLGLSLKPYQKTALEDLHVQCYWNAPLDLADNKGETAVIFIPRIALGVWIPTGEENDAAEAFFVPTGNNGFFGGTVDASLGLDFPVLPKGHSLQFNLGGGFMFSSEKDEDNQRIHSSELQSGIIHWKTSIKHRPGTTWYMNASMMADGVVDGLAMFFDFIYTQHLADSITLKTADATQKAAFEAGLPRTIRETAWKNQQVNGGFNYKIAEALSVGGAVQAHISGVRVMRSVTLLGGVTLTF